MDKVKLFRNVRNDERDSLESGLPLALSFSFYFSLTLLSSS